MNYFANSKNDFSTTCKSFYFKAQVASVEVAKLQLSVYEIGKNPLSKSSEIQN